MKLFKSLAVFSLLVLLLSGCGSSDTDKMHIKDLKVAFVPSAPAEDIMLATEPLSDMLKKELEDQGYTVDKVTITVGTSYEAVGTGLANGTIDLGFIPGGTYVLYRDQGVTPILTATRGGLDKDFTDAIEWNDGNATIYTDESVTFYRSLLITGPSAKGMELAEKVNSGQDLTWEDYDSANICVQSPTSSSGYLYPSLYLKDTYGKTFDDLTNSPVQANGYGDSIGRLASSQCDITPIYSDARMNFGEDWTTTFGRSNSIWDETSVIGVSDKIFNDTVSVSDSSSIMDDELKSALQTSLINIAGTQEGLDVIKIYSHTGYEIADPSNYDKEQQVLDEIVK